MAIQGPVTLILAGAAALAYLVLDGGQWPRASLIAKGLSVSALALHAGLSGALATSTGTLLVLALGLSSLGDVLLNLALPRALVLGLGAFLLAHVAYLALLAGLVTGMPGPGAWAAIALVLAGGLGLFAWLWPGLGGMAGPVAAYMVALLAMAVLAIAHSAENETAPWAALGAVLFVISDGVIAVDRFRRPVPGRHALVWIPYVAAQWLLGLSLLDRAAG